MNIVMAVGEDDIEKCLQIARDLPEWFNEAGLKAMERELREEKTFVAVEGGEVLGFVAIKPLNEKALEILWIAVRRELRGKGIGTELFQFVEEWARERGFYERRGFVRIALIDPYLEWGEPALIYAKCLR